jgi:prolyl-tRNA editing enzyme YbaK/EbsC (Cys-tRNA(Pro) deacylase)
VSHSFTPSTIESHPSVVRVRDALATHGIVDRIVVLPDSARTAQLAADALGCQVAQIANSLVFRLTASNHAVLVLSSGAKRVDVTRLTAIVGEPVGKADAAFVRDTTGFVIGGVAPVGHAAPIQKMVERSLFAFGEIWAAAGHPNTVFRLTPDELVQITAADIVDVAVA